MQAEDLKTVGVGAAGVLGTVTLSHINLIVSIAVGVASLVYVLAKTYLLIYNHIRNR